MVLHPRLSRALYRSLLRASHQGQYPQVFGQYGAQVLAQQLLMTDEPEHAALALPSTPRQVRQRLQQCFRNNNNNNNNNGDATSTVVLEPLKVLRHVYNQQALLLPTFSCGQELPIFEYDQVAALPGELLQTMFLEPRYVHLLLPHVLSSASQQFLLRPSPQSETALLVKLVSHQYISFATPTSTTCVTTSTPHQQQVAGVAVVCQAGPRVVVKKEVQQAVITDVILNQDQVDSNNSDNEINTGFYNGVSTSTAPLTKATLYSYKRDYDEEEDNHHQQPYYNTASISTSTLCEHYADTRQYILHLLQCAIVDDTHLATTLATDRANFGLPPLDAQEFSFWALRFVLHIRDVPSRLYWLHHCFSTRDRLEFVVAEIHNVLQAQQQDQRQRQRQRRRLRAVVQAQPSIADPETDNQEGEYNNLPAFTFG